MLERVRRKGNTLTLLVGMQTSTATIPTPLFHFSVQDFCHKAGILKSREFKNQFHTISETINIPNIQHFILQIIQPSADFFPFRFRELFFNLPNTVV